MDQIASPRRALIERELSRVDGACPGQGKPLSKHRKMAANPFRFLRGAAQIYYADLKSGMLALPAGLCESVRTTAILGDCHMANFGFVTEKGSHGGNIIFTPNDFDDACIGHAAWDLSRFATSIFLAADFSRGILDGRYRSDEIDDPSGLSAPTDEEAREAAQAFLKRYRKTCEAILEDPRNRTKVVGDFRKGHVLHGALKKARRRSIGGKDFEEKSTLGKAVEIGPKGPRFWNRPGRFKRLNAATARSIKSAFRPYVDDSILDIVARLGAGTGSVNIDRYYLLVGPEELATVEDLALCHLVEIKQQRVAAPLHAFPDLDPQNTLNPAHLTIDIQRLVQREPDLLLDEVDWKDVHWIVRSRHHARVDMDPEEICLSDDGKSGRRLKQYAQACGEVLALVHSRGDRRSVRFETAIAGALKNYSDELIAAAETYAGQTAEDWRTLNLMLQEASGDDENGRSV